MCAGALRFLIKGTIIFTGLKAVTVLVERNVGMKMQQIVWHEDNHTSEHASLYGLIARDARVAVLFRRGPSRRVRLILWNLETDRLEPGQWFRGRVYERRCDLSPDGKHLIYFAASFRKPYYSWTAISRPPYFTALALWPKGDCWGGGGLFSKRNIQLNHRPSPPKDSSTPDEMKLAEGFRLGKAHSIEPLGEQSGWGEDDPIRIKRMIRDGWVWVSGAHYPSARRPKGSFSFWNDKPFVAQKVLGASNGTLPRILQLVMHGHGEKNGPWNVETAEIIDHEGHVLHDFGRVDWIDKDQNGDVIYAQDGCVYRLTDAAEAAPSSFAPKLVADLRSMAFSVIQTPSFAKTWHEDRPGR